MGLRKDGKSVWMACPECHSDLVLQHPAYAGNSVSVSVKGGSASLEGIPQRKPDIRWWTRDMTPTQLSALPSVPGFYSDAKGEPHLDPPNTVQSVFSHIQGPVAEGSGSTFSSYLEGQEIEDLNVPLIETVHP